MVTRKNKFAALVGVCILGLALSGNVFAKSKKVRLNVGFGSEEVLENLQTTPLQINEMGAVYWPLVYPIIIRIPFVTMLRYSHPNQIVPCEHHRHDHMQNIY